MTAVVANGGRWTGEGDGRGFGNFLIAREAGAGMYVTDGPVRRFKPSIPIFLVFGIVLTGMGLFALYLWVSGAATDDRPRDAAALLPLLMFLVLGLTFLWAWFAMSIEVSPSGYTVTGFFRRTRKFLRKTDWAEVQSTGGDMGSTTVLLLLRHGKESKTHRVVVQPFYGRKSRAILDFAWGAPRNSLEEELESSRELYLEETVALLEALGPVARADSKAFEIQWKASKVKEEKSPTSLWLFVPSVTPEVSHADGYIKPFVGVFDKAGGLLGQVRITVRSGRLDRLEFLRASGIDFEGFPDPNIVTYKPLKSE